MSEGEWPGSTWPVQLRYAVAIAAFGAALALRLLLLPAAAGLGFLTFYPALMLCFLLCGTGPGALVTVLSAATAYYLFFAPHASFAYKAGGVAAAAVFLLYNVAFAQIARTLRSYGRRLQDSTATLRLSEQRYLAVLQDQTDVICRYLADGTLVFVNDAFCQLVGKSREELVGSKWRPLAVADDLPHIERKLGELSTARPVVLIENRIHAGDGRIHWMQFVNRAFFDGAGRLIEAQSVGRDVTERKTLEQKLVAAVREVQDLYDSAPCGYHSLDRDGRFVAINATELKWLGCRREEVLGKLGPSDFFTEAGREQFRRMFPQFLRAGQIADLEFDVIGRGGQRRHVSVSATTVRDADGNFLMSRGVMYDVTERQRALDAAQTMAEEMERRVVQRTEQLRVLASELEAAENRERQQLSRDLHDDLGQTLAAARIRLAALLDDPRDEVRASAANVAALIDAANRSIRALAAQLAPAILYELGLGPALEWLGEELEQAFGLTVTVLDDGLPKELSQEGRSIVFRAVRELLVNVAKHARTDAATVEVMREDDRIVVRVSDAGIGYDTARVAAAPRPGFGLVSVRERLSFIGGTADIRSAPGGGTVAVLSAPLASPVPAPAEVPA